MTANTQTNSVPWDRLDKNNAVVVIVDQQIGLFHLTREWDHALYHNNMMAHAALGKLFDLPVVITTSAESGPNGPVPKAILDMYPDAPLIKRQSEISAWDNADFRKAIEETDKKEIILAGIVTDVFRDSANERMRQAGVYVVSMFYIVADLLRDWRNPPGAAEALPWLSKYFPVYGMLAQAHSGALKAGALMPGEDMVG